MKEDFIPRSAVTAQLENAKIIGNGEYSGYCCKDISIDSIPAASVETVVHCYECVKWHPYENTAGCGYCHLHGESRKSITEPTFFCKGGVPRPNSERPKRYWIAKHDWYYCPACNAEAPVDREEFEYRGKVRADISAYCPACGTKLDGAI